MSALEPSDVALLAELFEQRGWRWLRLRVGTAQLELGSERHPPEAAVDGGSNGLARPGAGLTGREAQSPPDPAAPPRTPVVQPAQSVLHEVTAPNLGAFYRAPTPGAEPYVTVGQAVGADDEVGLLEVMKLYTPVRAGVSGVVREICVADGELVEFGQRLLLVQPDQV